MSVLEGEADKHQRVGRQDRQDHLDGGAHHGDDQCCSGRTARTAPWSWLRRVVLQVHALRKDPQVHGDDLARLLEGAQEHPQQRQEHHQGGEQQRDVAAGDVWTQVGRENGAGAGADGVERCDVGLMRPGRGWWRERSRVVHLPFDEPELAGR